jgi:hypothetical protein
MLLLIIMNQYIGAVAIFDHVFAPMLCSVSTLKEIRQLNSWANNPFIRFRRISSGARWFVAQMHENW